MSYENLKIGDYVFYTGDIKNQPCKGIISDIRPPDRWGGLSYDIALADGRETLGIYPSSFGKRPGDRFWLWSEWVEYQQQRIAQAQADFIAMMKKREQEG